MKRILITGYNSYIGTSVERYLMQYNAGLGKEEYRIDTISQRDETWETYNFSPYDAVFHVSGIAHADVGKTSEGEKALYYQVNCDLAVRTAAKAKAQGVHQFIFMSSVIVYGDSAPVGGTKHITGRTPCTPANFYGNSKLQAENGLRELEEGNFHVAILRAPFIYGKGCKGNYPLMAGLAKRLLFFPDLGNQRSMLYIENLAEFIRMLIDDGRGGLFFPQNREYTTTSQMVLLIGAVNGRRIRLWGILNPLVILLSKMPGKAGKMANKAFGSLTVDQALSKKDFDGYQIFSLEESIRRTEERA